MNQIQILGTITRDVELRYGQSGNAFAKFGIAYNDKWTAQNGEKMEKAHFFDVSVFGKQAETINQYFRKGNRILISGSLAFESWQDDQGQKRSKVGIKMERFDFIDRKDDNQQQGGYNAPQSQNPNQGYNQPPQQQNASQPPVYNQQIDQNGNPVVQSQQPF